MRMVFRSHTDTPLLPFIRSSLYFQGIKASRTVQQQYILHATIPAQGYGDDGPAGVSNSGRNRRHKSSKIYFRQHTGYYLNQSFAPLTRIYCVFDCVS